MLERPGRRLQGIGPRAHAHLFPGERTYILPPAHLDGSPDPWGHVVPLPLGFTQGLHLDPLHPGHDVAVHPPDEPLGPGQYASKRRRDGRLEPCPGARLGGQDPLAQCPPLTSTLVSFPLGHGPGVPRRHDGLGLLFRDLERAHQHLDHEVLIFTTEHLARPLGGHLVHHGVEVGPSLLDKLARELLLVGREPGQVAQRPQVRNPFGQHALERYLAPKHLAHYLVTDLARWSHCPGHHVLQTPLECPHGPAYHLLGRYSWVHRPARHFHEEVLR